MYWPVIANSVYILGIFCSRAYILIPVFSAHLVVLVVVVLVWVLMLTSMFAFVGLVYLQ